MTETRRSTGAVAALGALEIDDLGRRVVSKTNLPQKFTQVPIRAELIGSDRCEAEGITVRATAPVLALCRAAELEPSPRGVGFVRRPAVRGSSPIGENSAGQYPTPLPRTSASGDER